MVRVLDDRSVTINGSSAAPRVSRRRPPQQVASAPVSPPPQTVQELTAALMAVIRRYREARGSGAGTDVALALAAADRENFRLGRR